MIEMPSIITYTLIFFLIAIAAKQIGKFFSKYGLPYITGYLLAGALAGPFILGMLPQGATTELRYIDDISLAIIAFVAGSELYLKELRSRLRGILLNTMGIVIVASLLLGVAFFFLQSMIPFTADLPAMTKVAVALLGGTILLALSPASTIAVIQEVRAKGPFSKTVLSITVVMDVVIIVLFAVSVAVASTMMDGSSIGIGFAIILLVDIIIALVAGYLIGQLLGGIIGMEWDNWIKIGFLLLIGFLIFESSYHVPDMVYAAIGFKLKIEPLLIAMVAGFTITNFTNQRQSFEALLHEITPMVYVAFFALTGVALKLDVLLSTLGIAVALFLVRMVSIGIGTYLGGTLARESAPFRQWAWMGLITQAGIALGLARETAVEFPDTLGAEFATLIISVVVLNEIFGPLFLKFALRKVGESRDLVGDGEGRRAVVWGIEPQSIALARQLTREDWDVQIADTNEARVQETAVNGVPKHYIAEITEESVVGVANDHIDALVVMLDNDAQSLRVCEIIRDTFTVRSIVARLHDPSLRTTFEALDVHVLDPALSMVSLLHQYVRAPESVDLLLRQDETHEVMQVTVFDKSAVGLPLRDLRLPVDVLVLEILRAGQSIVPHGFSKLQLADEVTLVGSPDSLSQVAFKLGY